MFTIASYVLCSLAVEKIMFTKELEDITITDINQTATLECELSKSGLKVEWYRGNKQIRRDGKHDIVTDGKTQKLVIEKVMPDEAGEYSATYQNLTTSAKLTVAVPPNINMENLKDRLVLKAGSSAAIEVPFTGSPQPEVTWKYKGGKLPDARRFKVDTIIGMTSMTLAKVVRSDSGKYSLTLENPHGKASYNVEVVVLGKCKYVLILGIGL